MSYIKGQEISFPAIINITGSRGTEGLKYTPYEDGLVYFCTGQGYARGTDIKIADKIEGTTVQGIGDYAFSECYKITSVRIPDSVRSIGSYAFSRCDSLKNIIIGNGVTDIYEGAFEDCISLESITIPDSVTEIGDYAFRGCESLKSITIGEGIVYIGENAFSGCTDIHIYVPWSEDKVAGAPWGAINPTIHYNSPQ